MPSIWILMPTVSSSRMRSNIVSRRRKDRVVAPQNASRHGIAPHIGAEPLGHDVVFVPDIPAALAAAHFHGALHFRSVVVSSGDLVAASVVQVQQKIGTTRRRHRQRPIVKQTHTAVAHGAEGPIFSMTVIALCYHSFLSQFGTMCRG